MAIRIFPDRIQIGSFNLFEGGGGIQFDGVAMADNFYGNQGFQGTVAGFAAGGYVPGTGSVNTIDKFPFATDTNASDHGDLPGIRTSSGTTGQSSSTHGYQCGGISPGNTQFNTIFKYPFSASSGSSDIGDLLITFWGPTGHSSGISGYVSATYTGGYLNNINKFPFATDTNATDVGDLVTGTYLPGGQSSATHGYTSGGQAPATPRSGLVSKFSFVSDANATDASTLTQARMRVAGQSSISYGYNSGGDTVNTIDRFPFSADTNATDVGDLTVARGYVSGQTSTVSGYTSGGFPPTTNTIDKFPFSADSNATDVGDLSQARNGPTGTQD